MPECRLETAGLQEADHAAEVTSLSLALRKPLDRHRLGFDRPLPDHLLPVRRVGTESVADLRDASPRASRGQR